MNGYLVQAAIGVVLLTVQHVWLRPRLHRRIAAAVCARIVVPAQRRARNARRSLAALARAAHHRPHRPTHALTTGATDDQHEHRLAA